MPPRTLRLRPFSGLIAVLAVGFSVPLGGPVAAQAPTAPPTFQSGIELVTVDAVVLDRDGRPVPGLTREDFVVKEEGRPREIASFEAFDVGALAEEPAPPAVVASNEPRGAGRAFAIVLDDLSMAPAHVPAARETATRFLERFVREGDLVTVATSSGDVWWSARIPEGREDLEAVLSRVRGRHVDVPVLDQMTDYEAFWIANHEGTPSLTPLTPGTSIDLPGRATSSGSGSAPEPLPPGSIKERVKQRWQRTQMCVPTYCDTLVRARAAEIDTARRGRLELTLGCVRRALEALAPVRGRKSLLLLSEGFLQDSGSDARAVAAASREANTAVYFIDARGLVALPAYGTAADVGPPPDERERTAVAFEEATVESAGAAGLADDTGGFTVRNTNDLSAGVWRIAAESRVFYLLGFYPAEGKKGPGEWRKLHVEVNRPGLTVRARRGYTLRSEMAAASPAPPTKKGPEVAPVVVHALDSAHTAAGIPLRAIAYLQEPRPGDLVHVLVAAELDAATVAASGGAARLEASAQIAARDSGRVYRKDAAVTVAGAREGPAWRAFTREFEVPPGVAQLRLVVRDPAGGAIGSLLQRLEIPFPGEFRLSTPILTDRVEPGAPGQPPRPALAAHRVFTPGGGLYCRYEVFGAARPGGAAPRVTASFELRRGDGQTVRQASPTPIVPDRDGRLVRTVGMSLEGLTEGDYELLLEVSDETTDDRILRHEAFVLAAR
ncbi:MAG TPA: VWA domain-containing protein [Vicinamibacteria bacterium]|nr:VWA domain-containing protein [Vicinamibacteria bacterium]